MRRADWRGSSQSRPTILIGLASLLLLARIAAEVHEANHPPRIQDLIGWHLPSEQLEPDSKRPTLYLFTADWCMPCRQLEREVFIDPEGARLIRDSFVPVKVVDHRQEDGENRPAEDALIKRFGIDGYPTLVVARRTGAPVRLDGYNGRDTVFRFLRAQAGSGPSRPQYPQDEEGASGTTFRLQIGR
jgi:thiol:disulfide interchange protein